MSTVGLTKARQSALALLAECRNADDFAIALQAVGRTMLRALHTAKLIDDEGRPNTRGHAALAAPRVTAAELAMLERCETLGRGNLIVLPNGPEFETLRRLKDRDWITSAFVDCFLTPAGRTALNNVRAAMGSPDWKEGL